MLIECTDLFQAVIAEHIACYLLMHLILVSLITMVKAGLKQHITSTSMHFGRTAVIVTHTYASL